MHIRAVINTSPGRTDRLKSLPILLVRFTFVNARGFGARLFRTRVTRDDKLFFHLAASFRGSRGPEFASVIITAKAWRRNEL